MVTLLFLVVLLAQDAPQDRLAPILRRWREGGEEQRLRALRDAAAIRPEAGEAALGRFAETPVPETWDHPGDLLDLVSREKIASWYGLLVPLLSSRDADVRLRALEELTRRDQHHLAGSVVPLLKDPDGRAAWQAAYTLIQMEAHDRVPELVPLLKDPGGSVRPNVFQAVLHLGGREHGPLLVPLLADPDPAVAIAAVRVLGKVGARDAAPRVATFLTASDPAHRQAAIAALAAMGARDHAKQIAERLDDDQTLVRWEAVRALGRLRAREYALRIAVVTEDDGGLAPGLEAMGSLGLRDLAPRIVPFLETPDPGIRWRAVKALGDVDATGEAAKIAAMLKDPDSFVRRCALQALAAIGAREHVGAMLDLLRDEESEVSQTAAEEISLLATPEQLRSVVPLLKDEDPIVRLSALRLLVGAGAKEHLPAIAAGLGTGPVLNRDVVWAIGRLGGKEYRDQIAAALMNDDELVRQQAVFALARLPGSTKELEAADRSAPGPTQLAAGFALVRLGRKTRAEAAALLREYLLHRDEPDYQLFPDEIFEALAMGRASLAPVMLGVEIRCEKRVDTVWDLFRKMGFVEPQPDRTLRRRLPAGSALPVRRALEWSFGSDARVVPLDGGLVVLDTARALEFWQKRLDAK